LPGFKNCILQAEEASVRGRTKASVWAASGAATLAGAFIAALLVSAGMCEDSGSVGSDAYCRDGGMETALIAILIDVAAVVVGPAAALLTGRERGFKFWLVAPLLGLPLILLVTHFLGT
jgi:hypothetical protein